MQRTRFLMLGGFLGAGKTTAIARLARYFTDVGLRVGLVTNDQAFDLVDTQSLRAQGFDVGEVTGACFCCKFNDLVGTMESLSAENRPDVILAEPVGSCTDLAATVIEPLRQLYGDTFEVGPLAVLLKPEHGRKILSDEPGLGFSPKAAYIFLKQLEEADVVALNKIDKLAAEEQTRLVELVQQRFPGKRVLAVSARHGHGFETLVEAMQQAERPRKAGLEIDYDTYAEGEAELGWLNCTVHLATSEDTAAGFSLDEVLLDFVTRLKNAMAALGAESAHLKVFGTLDGSSAIANLVASDERVDLSFASHAEGLEAQFTVNARVAVAPEELEALVAGEVAALAAARNLDHRIESVQSFRPGRPVPTHRMTSGA